MELRTIRAFVEVVRQGGFTQAAKTVFATQSTVSKAVKQLEDELGVRLLDRVGHRSTLTEAGEIVFRRAVGMLAQREDLTAELDDLRGLRRGTLRLGLPPIGSSVVFAPLFAAYRQRHPGIEIRLTEYGADRLRELLHAGDIELGGLLLPVADEFESEQVRRAPLVAMLPSAHPLAQRKLLSVTDLRPVPFLLFETGFALNRIILDLCRRYGFEPAVAARSSQVDFLVELAAAGLGVTFLPDMIAAQRPHMAVTAVPIAERDAEWNMAMIWRRGAYLSHAARAWLDLVRESQTDPNRR